MTGWNCPVCGEGYPSSDNAAVPRNGVIILVMQDDMAELRQHLPHTAVITSVVEADDTDDDAYPRETTETHA